MEGTGREKSKREWDWEEGEMEKSLHEAAKKGDTSIFVNVDKFWHKHFSSRRSNQNNMIRLAVENRQLDFLKEALKRFPMLLNPNNPNCENTPLHVASRLGYTDILSFLISHFQQITITATSTTTINADGSWLLATNEEGDTAFHVALKNRNIEAASTFCAECTQDQLKLLFDIRNCDGQTPLHLLARYHPANDLFDDSEDIRAVYRDIFHCADYLRRTQDKDGNTPLHVAIKSAKFSAAKFLLQRCIESEQRQELSIKNDNRDLVFDLLAPQLQTTDILLEVKDLKEMMMRAKRLVKEQALLEKEMDDELYEAAVALNWKMFVGVGRRNGDDLECGSILNPGDARFLSQTTNGCNIIHIALRQSKEEGEKFIKEALGHFPSLLIQADSNGDIPLHLAAKWDTPISRALLTCIGDVYRSVLLQHKRGVLVHPLRTKNSKGNMPIHEALRFNNVFAALVLMRIDPRGALCVNDFGETPLHLYARFHFFPVDTKKDELLETLITQNKSAAYVRDKDGLTPLLKAAKSGHFRVVLNLLEHCPQSAYIPDLNGRTFLHLLRCVGGDVHEHSADQLFKDMGKNLFTILEADAQRLVLDCEGNTPLHYAIKTENSITAGILTQRCMQTEDQLELMLANNEGHTVLDLLASHEAPTEVVHLIRNTHGNIMSASSFRVRKADIKHLAGSLSVVAGLLATLTFAVAFQVPGGFNSDNGSRLIEKGGIPGFLGD